MKTIPSTSWPANCLGLLLFASGLITSCEPEHLRPMLGESGVVKDSVSRMMDKIAGDVSRIGPIAWLNYFENTPDFFMASEGELAFGDHAAAKTFIQNSLVKSIRQINLLWANIRIDPITTRIASVGANFHEGITDSSGKIISEDGYFTAIAEQSNEGWRLLNAHWSTHKPK